MLAGFIACEVDDGHPAFCEFVEKGVAVQGCSNGQQNGQNRIGQGTDLQRLSLMGINNGLVGMFFIDWDSSLCTVLPQMKENFMESKMFHVAVCATILGVASVVTADVYVPPTPGGFGSGTSGGGGGSSSTTAPSVGMQGNNVVFFYGAPPAGVKLGEPDVVVPMRDATNKPILVPISQVNLVIQQGGSADNNLIVMHKGTEQIAIDPADLQKYKDQGYAEGPKEGTKKGVVEVQDGVTVVNTGD